VERPNSSPDEFASATDSVVIIERALDHEGLFDLRMLMHGQGCTRLPLEEAGHLAFCLILVKHLDRDTVKLRRLPRDFVRLHVDRAANRGLDDPFPGCCRRFLHRVVHGIPLGHGYCRSSDFGFPGGARRGTRLIGPESFPRRSKPCRASASSPFDVALPDTRASFSSLVSSMSYPPISALAESPDGNERNASDEEPLAPIWPRPIQTATRPEGTHIGTRARTIPRTSG